MKRTLLLLLLCLCFGCTKEMVYEKIDSNDPRLNESLKGFYQVESNTYVQGEYFQIKLLPIYKVKFNDSAYDTSYSFYRYQVLIAPLVDAAIQLKDVTFEPKGLKNYYDSIPMGRNGLRESQFELSKLTYQKNETLEEQIAFRGDFTISNAGDDYQHDSSISDEQFDNAMKTLVFTIKFNDQEEKITVTSQDELMVIDHEDQLKDMSRDDLYDLFEEGGCHDFFAPYRNQYMFE